MSTAQRFRLRYSPALLFAAGAAASLCSSSVSADVVHSPKGYTVTLPHGWQTQHETHTQPDGWSTDMMIAHPPNAFPVFRMEVDPQGRATVQSAEAMQAAFIQKKVPGFRIIEQRLWHVAGSPASETAAGGSFQGQMVIMDLLYTIHSGKGYTMTLITTPKREQEDMKTFTHILNTLRWTD